MARTNWTRRTATTILAEHRASGLSLAEFARSRGLQTKRLYYWRQRLALLDSELERAQKPVEQQRAPQQQLVSIEVIQPRRASPSSGQGGHPAPQLSLRTGTGLVIDVGDNFNADTLRRLLAVLDEGPSC